MSYLDLFTEAMYAPFLKYKFLQVVILKDALSDHLWTPLSMIAGSPKGALAVVLVLYLVIVLIWLPLKLISLLITEDGTYLVLLALFYKFGNTVALYLSFPGCFKTVQRDIEKEYSRRVLQKIDLATQAIGSWASDLRDGPSACGDPSGYQTRHATALWFQREVILVLREAIELVVDVGRGEPTGLGGPLPLSPNTAGETSLLHALLMEIDRLVTELTPLGDILVNCNYYQRNAQHAKLKCDMKFSPPPSSLPNKDLPQALSVDQVADSLLACIQRLRLLAPRLRISNQGESMFSCFFNLYESRHPITQTCCSLPLMRAEVVARFKAKVFRLKFEDYIDVCIIPLDDTTTSTAKVNKDIPAVVFCNPNAGMWECSNMSPKCADWIDFYKNLGMQVVMFNYRGYGRSGGAPTPKANSADCLALVQHLRGVLGVKRIVLHGESIGGLCAAYVGAQEGLVDLLVIDRTFANLGAVAQYLVGGWTVPALRIFTGWDTDVMKNYMSASCPKICCSDVDDQIIAEPGSLKSALACYLELSDVDVVRVPLAQDYALAELVDDPPPGRVDPPSSHDALTEANIQHFAQCLRYVARKAKAFSRVRESSEEVSKPNNENNQAGDAELSAYTSKDAMMAQGAWLGEANKPVEGQSEKWGLLVSDVEEGQSRPSPCSPIASMEHAATLDPSDEFLERAWTLLAGCDGRCGQLLGHAVVRGLPWVRSWVCSLVAWQGGNLISNVPGCDTFIHNFVSVQAVSENLDKILADNSRAGGDAQLKYISSMFHYLLQRLERSGEEKQRAMKAKLGTLVPLHCGHNAPYSDLEKRMLQHQITSVMSTWAS